MNTIVIAAGGATKIRNCLGSQKPPGNILKPPRKLFVVADRQAKCTKSREPRNGSQLPRITFLAVLLHGQVN